MLKVALGKTGLEISRAGMGVLPIGPGQLDLPLEEGADVICHAVYCGINFFDTAQYYKTYPYLRRAFEILGSKSDNLIISSKSLCHDYEDMNDAIKEAQQELNRDVIDIFLMHEVRSGGIEERKGAWQALVEAKERGIVRAIGISTHHVDITEQAASLKDCDVIFPIINYAGMGIRKENMPAAKEEMLEAIKKCHDAGLGVFSMKAFGGGNLTEHYQEALDYVFSKKEIDSVMIGFGCRSDIDDLVSYLDGTMSSDYNPDVSNKKVRVNQTDCEGCGSCIKVCASQAIFYNKNGLAEIDQSRCITCGYCSYACPSRAIIRF